MGGRYTQYPEYNASRVEWLEDTPIGWNTARLKQISNINMGQSPNSDECNTDGLGPPFLQGNAEFGAKYPSPKSYCGTARKTAFEGELLFSVRAPVGALNVANQSYGIGRGLCSILSKPEIAQDFLWWVLLVAKTQLDAVSTGSTFEAVSAEQVGNCYISVPPLPEQTKIAAFLDHETAKIDALIAKQERMIELLEEKRQAVISHAVTKGLDPTAPLRPSGIDWLGDVPVHWETRKVSKLTTKITNGYVGPTRDILVDEGLPYVQATHVKRGRVNFDNAYFVTKGWSDKHSKSILKIEDVLIVQTGAGTGDVACVSSEEEGYNCHALIVLTPMKEVINGRYLALALRSQYGQAVLFSIRTGGMHPHLNCGEVQFVPLPLPPIAEQLKIADFVERQTHNFDEMNTKGQSAINLLKERRTALISAAVTGKIDLRDWTPPEASQHHTIRDINQPEEALT